MVGHVIDRVRGQDEHLDHGGPVGIEPVAERGDPLFRTAHEEHGRRNGHTDWLLGAQ